MKFSQKSSLVLRRFSINCALLLIAACALVARADDSGRKIETVLKAAGENRPQVEAALAKVPAGQAEGMRFLVANMPDGDLKNLSAEFLLEDVNLAYRAWNESPWKDRVSTDMFLNYVLPYAVVDEPRVNWRKSFYEHYRSLIGGIDEPAQAAVALNQKLFPLVKVHFSANRKRANQSPLETIEDRKASCTGLSILLVDACRAFGVPARLTGTPDWIDNSGNHSWVEIWDGEAWHFTGAAEPKGNNLDKGWFADRATTALRDEPLHAIYAAQFKRGPLVFPPAWSRQQGTVYAVNVTDRYTKHAKPREKDQIVVRFRVLDKPGGQRVVAKLLLTTQSGKVVAKGNTRDDRFDPNDNFEAVVWRNRPLRMQLLALDRKLTAEIKTLRDQELFTYYLSDAEQ